MTNLLLKTKTELFKWLQQQKERQAQTPAENSEKLQGSIFVSLFQFKVHRTNCEQIALPSSSRACEHVHLIYLFI